jgi:hypothetical protein
MSVYFVSDPDKPAIKIGKSSRIRKRLSELQTGNPSKLKLMGWIETLSDTKSEKMLHRKYKNFIINGEWFSITQDHVLNELKKHNGYIPKSKDAFAVVGYDRDGVAEYMGVCDWNDFELHECCPFCGCFCGMHYQEASSMYYCIECGTLTDFSELSSIEE